MSDKSSHYYDKKGNPRHTIVGKNGKERAPRIKEVMELGLYPSTTTKLGIIKNFQLEDWRTRTLVKWTFCYPPRPQETDDAYVVRVLENAFTEVSEAADLGTQIHAAIEQHYAGKPYDPKMGVYVEAVDKWVKENEVEFRGHELRLVNKTIGYAGTTDAAFTCPKGYGIMDFKSRKTKEGEKVVPYDTHIMQIAAYHTCYWGQVMAEMNPKTVGCNLYISTTEPGRVEAVWYSAADLEKAWDAFVYASRLWDYFKGYTPPQ